MRFSITSTIFFLENALRQSDWGTEQSSTPPDEVMNNGINLTRILKRLPVCDLDTLPFNASDGFWDIQSQVFVSDLVVSRGFLTSPNQNP
jgi:hypothetical protein